MTVEKAGFPRPFILQRHEDETGVSGTGVVAWGVEFPDGVVSLRWNSQWPTSVVFHDRGIDAVRSVHGHGGKTDIVWLDWVPRDEWPRVAWNEAIRFTLENDTTPETTRFIVHRLTRDLP